jgi:hypothetical protein
MVKEMISNSRPDSEWFFFSNEVISKEVIDFRCLICAEFVKIIYLEANLFISNKFSNLRDQAMSQKIMHNHDELAERIRISDNDYFDELQKFKYNLDVAQLSIRRNFKNFEEEAIMLRNRIQTQKDNLLKFEVANSKFNQSLQEIKRHQWHAFYQRMTSCAEEMKIGTTETPEMKLKNRCGDHSKKQLFQ